MAVAVWIDTHPLDLLGTLVAQSLRLGHLELAQHGLQAGIAVITSQSSSLIIYMSIHTGCYYSKEYLIIKAKYPLWGLLAIQIILA